MSYQGNKFFIQSDRVLRTQNVNYMQTHVRLTSSVFFRGKIIIRRINAD